MSGDGQREVRYMNTAFPYSNTENFMDRFEGLTHVPANYANFGLMHDQQKNLKENDGVLSEHLETSHALELICSVFLANYTLLNCIRKESAPRFMNMNLYKFGTSGYEGTTFYTPYEVNDNFPRVDASRRIWGYPSVISVEVPTAMNALDGNSAVMGVNTIFEECNLDNHNANVSEECPLPPEALVVWQRNIDPDDMTYEELLDLGEAIGTQSRGLSEELIDLLPTSKYKFADFFARKKSWERCVICQMRYKIGDRQIKLPCRHAYHSKCVRKWLSINKICPICNTEVFEEESRDGE